MAGVSSFNPFSFTLSVSPPASQFVSNSVLFPPKSIRFAFRTVAEERLRVADRARLSGRAKAVSQYAASTGTALNKEEINLLKKKLMDSFQGTDRGMSAMSDTRAEIVELISLLEAVNPNPSPTEALPLLNGKWILAYTSFVSLFPLLSSSLPIVKVEEISQTIDSENFTAQNSIQFSGPLATACISTNAKFEIRSPKRVQIKFEEGVIGTPQLTDSLVLPENVEFLGQSIDLSPFKGIITSVQDTASMVAKTISSQPPLKFSISNSHTESWLLTTYLDEELRISKGDGDNVFVLIKAGSSLLRP